MTEEFVLEELKKNKVFGDSDSDQAPEDDENEEEIVVTPLVRDFNTNSVKFVGSLVLYAATGLVLLVTLLMFFVERSWMVFKFTSLAVFFAELYFYERAESDAIDM